MSFAADMKSYHLSVRTNGERNRSLRSGYPSSDACTISFVSRSRRSSSSNVSVNFCSAATSDDFPVSGPSVWLWKISAMKPDNASRRMVVVCITLASSTDLMWTASSPSTISQYHCGISFSISYSFLPAFLPERKYLSMPSAPSHPSPSAGTVQSSSANLPSSR